MYYIGFLRDDLRRMILFHSSSVPVQRRYVYFGKVVGPYDTESEARFAMSALKRAYGYTENPVRGKSRAQYCRERQESPSKFAKGSFRTITLGKGKKGVVACPKGYYHRGKCSKGTHLQTILHPVGSRGCSTGGLELRKRKRNPGKVTANQIKRGILHELEHTTDREIARKIACDHLKEDPKYYTHLEAMEKRVKKGKSSKLYMSDRQALALTKKIIEAGKRLFRHERSELKQNPGKSYHDRKFLSYLGELEKYKIGSQQYIGALAKAYEHLESARESVKQGMR